MNKKMISQELYDNLCLSLGRNAKALKGDAGFATIKRRLERSARITFEGVEVDRTYLVMAQEALDRIVRVNGHKYDATLDKIVLLDIAEALAPAEAIPEEQEKPPSKMECSASTAPPKVSQTDDRDILSLGRKGSKILDLKPSPPAKPAITDEADKAQKQAEFDARLAAMGPPPPGCIWHPDMDGSFFSAPCPKALDALEEIARREGRF